jgi:hypothetical protein
VNSPFSRACAGLVALVLVLGGSLVVAAPASADVLVNWPGHRVCRGASIKVGVWYQSYSGGPRHYTVDVFAPGGRRVFHSQGRATTRWRFWRVRAAKLGRYRVVYRGSSSQGPWRAAYRVRSRRC